MDVARFVTDNVSVSELAEEVRARGVTGLDRVTVDDGAGRQRVVTLAAPATTEVSVVATPTVVAPLLTVNVTEPSLIAADESVFGTVALNVIVTACSE